MSTITGPNYLLEINVVAPYPESVALTHEDIDSCLDKIAAHPGESIATAPEFLAWWTKEASLRGVPSPRYTGSDYGIARRLLQKHGINRLKELALHFLRRHADPLTKGYPRHMILLQSKISTIEQELKDQA